MHMQHNLYKVIFIFLNNNITNIILIYLYVKLFKLIFICLLQVEKSTCDIQYRKFGDHLPLEEIWLGVVPIPSDHSFKNLKSLFVVECEYLPNVIPFYLLPFLCNLEEIHVINCKSIKAIFDVQDMRVDMKLPSQHSLPLKKLILSQLPNLEYIWNLMSDEFLSLQSLQEVYIYSCEKLKSLFPTSVANHLVMLDVRDCARLVEILVENEAALKGETKQFIFHCLISITLRKLPELKYFYNGKHSLEWPMLAYLDIYHCDKLKLFTSEHNSGEVADIEDQVGISNHQQAIFIVEKVLIKKISSRVSILCLHVLIWINCKRTLVTYFLTSHEIQITGSACC